MKIYPSLQLSADLHLEKETDSLIVYFRIKKERIMIYTHLGIEAIKSHTQALCSGQSLLNTVLHSGLRIVSGFQLNSTPSQIFLEL